MLLALVAVMDFLDNQYGWILLVSGVISKKAPQRSASFLVRRRFGVARGRSWRKVVARI